jgi:hypothetical protein
MKVIRGKKSGRIVGFRMSESEARSMDTSGLCLACGVEAEGIEPDARECRCSACGEMKVYGVEELVLMGRVVFPVNAA